MIKLNFANHACGPFLRHVNSMMKVACVDGLPLNYIASWLLHEHHSVRSP